MGSRWLKRERKKTTKTKENPRNLNERRRGLTGIEQGAVRFGVDETQGHNRSAVLELEARGLPRGQARGLLSVVGEQCKEEGASTRGSRDEAASQLRGLGARAAA